MIDNPSSTPTKHEAYSRTFYLFVLIVAIAGIPLGSNRDWAWPLLTIFFCGISIHLLTNSAIEIASWQKRILLPFLLVAGWILLQWIGIPFVFEPITIDALATRNDFLKTVTYILFVWLMCRLIINQRTITWLVYALLMVALGQALFSCLQVVTQLGNPAGIIRGSGSYASPNHYAGFMELTLSLGIGLLLGIQTGRHHSSTLDYLVSLITGPHMRLRLILVMLVIGLIVSVSRGGNAAFFTSLILTTGIALFISRKLTLTLFLLLASFLFVDTLLIGNYFGLDRLNERLARTSVESEFRDDISLYNLKIAMKKPWLGQGAGTYPLVITQYRDQSIPARFTHAENDYIEFVIELGILGSIPLLAILIMAYRSQLILLKRAESQFSWGIAFGCMTGTNALLLHSLVDFNLQIPANVLIWLIVLLLPQIILCRQPPNEPASSQPGA